MSRLVVIPFPFLEDVNHGIISNRKWATTIKSWATFEALTRCNKKCDHMSLRLQPVLLGALFKGVRSKPNGLKAKRIYMKTDLESLGISERKSEFLLHATKEEDIKRILKNNTKLAIGQGVFGVPTYVAHFRTGPELFFGSDQLFLLAYYLNITFPDYFLS
ncbi:uncharacterized protein LOC143452080 isoform X2 [Clavelina lepadiformis]|uniref:uncharacterized protein LOC143452080 isoform X2 n=1 Tax=Clavelina lepadiformis TaxID=159417 RepID=UPI0040423474